MMIKLMRLCGKYLGLLSFYGMSRRRFIAMTNLKHCFPELSETQIKALCKKNFANVGMGIFEAFAAWFMTDKQIARIPRQWIGKENYAAALKTGKGIIQLSSHMTPVEMAGRIFGPVTPAYYVYKPSHTAWVDRIVKKGRMRYAEGLLKHINMKPMVSKLREGQSIWLAPDQDFGPDRRSEFVPFCGVPAATVVATSVLAKIGNAIIMPLFFYRDDDCYTLVTLPHWDHFPSGNDYEDCKRYNDLLTEFVRQHPEQYLWIHRRFKTVASGSNIYAQTQP